jgi:hypothetical protein
VSGMKRRFSIRQVGRGRSGPGAVYEVVVRGFDERGYLYRESTVVSRSTGNDGTATRAEAQRHADWLNYAEECFYAGQPAPAIYEWPITDTEVDYSEFDASEAERRLALALVAGHGAADGVADR